MPASPPPADDSDELDDEDVFADDVLPALDVPVELLVLVATPVAPTPTPAPAPAATAAAVGSRRFGLILLDIGRALAAARMCLQFLWSWSWSCFPAILARFRVGSPAVVRVWMAGCLQEMPFILFSFFLSVSLYDHTHTRMQANIYIYMCVWVYILCKFRWIRFLLLFFFVVVFFFTINQCRWFFNCTHTGKMENCFDCFSPFGSPCTKLEIQA